MLVTLAILFGCSTGTVVLDDSSAGTDDPIDEAEPDRDGDGIPDSEDEYPDDPDNEPPVHEAAGEWEGGFAFVIPTWDWDVCEAEIDLDVDEDGKFEYDGDCEGGGGGWGGGDYPFTIQGEIDEDGEVDGEFTMELSFGGGYDVEVEATLNGDFDDDELFIEFRGTYEYDGYGGSQEVEYEGDGRFDR